MAFTGIPVIVKVSDRKFRITGVTLDAATGASIGLVQNPAVDVPLTAPGWGRYETSGIDGAEVSLSDSIEVTTRPAPTTLVVTKVGDNPEDFGVQFTNTSEANPIAFDEIYMEFH